MREESYLSRDTGSNIMNEIFVVIKREKMVKHTDTM